MNATIALTSPTSLVMNDKWGGVVVPAMSQVQVSRLAWERGDESLSVTAMHQGVRVRAVVMRWALEG